MIRRASPYTHSDGRVSYVTVTAEKLRYLMPPMRGRAELPRVRGACSCRYTFAKMFALQNAAAIPTVINPLGLEFG